ncbi:protein ALWAYS EARLY 2 isoform X2 [Cucumis sativus]|uniref:protein ALWAYS EARLY 2 isoform X2 n=1 Tax=Cucumis sativus TaxID=3659 RepID=UPI0005ECAE19|nr:protein ALWAYS EARLY 2 isoform X2 [Cucumis sativus]
MAPPKNLKSLKKRPLRSNDPSAEENYRSSQTSKKRTKKLSDKLGPQWSKEEIESFYEAYRKYGQDWKKVASSMHQRSTEMVETLYNMNKAYLSLPEGTASVVGLIALMTDYYNVMGGNDSERENYDASGFQELPKTNQVQVQLSISNEGHFSTRSVAASGGCLSSLRSLYGNRLRVVGKRTPRVPISYLEERDKGENHASGNKCSQKSEFDVISDEVAHGAASALAEASQRIDSSATFIPSKIKENMKFSYEVSGGHKGRPNETYDYDLSSPVATECVGTEKTHHKMKKRYRKEKVLDNQNSVLEGKVDSKSSNAVCVLSSSLVQRKKRRKLPHGDENTTLDALQILADVSSMIPFTTMKSEPSVQIVEETESFNLEDKSYIPEDTLSDRSDKGKQVMVNAMPNIEDRVRGKLKPGNGLSIDVASKRKKRLEHLGTMRKGKRNFVIPDTKVPVDVHLREDLTTITLGRIKPLKNENQATLPIKLGRRSRCKMELWKLLTRQKTKFCDDKLGKELMKYSSSVQAKAFFLKDKLSNCMSSTMVRRWCIFEWFYSAIDYPWFARSEFVEYLHHVGLGSITKLTRVEWGIIRSSLGRPRRFSDNFLHEERMKLQRYRESVRQYYGKLRAGICKGLPTDLARPLSVGQRIIALHPYPYRLEVHNGSVLRLQHDNYRIQFDNQEIGVKPVMDFECMPFNPMDNFPETFRRQICSINRAPLEYKELQRNNHPNVSRELEKRSSPLTTDTSVPSTTFNLKQHNTFSGNSLAPANARALGSIPCSLNVSQGSGRGAVDIVQGSREKAQMMVNVAIEVLLSKNDGDDPLTIIYGALHSSDNQNSSFKVQKPSSMSQNMKDCLGAHVKELFPSKHLSTADLSSLRSRHFNRDYRGIPSNLITSCVATLLMIQACIERPYPASDVSQILGLAVKSLHPRCSQNLHFYKEIETCVRRIQTQLLSIVPT